MSEQERKRYFEKARSWAEDQQVREQRGRSIAWTVAGIATAIALFEAVALAMLAPLKTVQPITLLVDRQTGYVQAIDPLQPRRIGADAALTQSMLAQYVANREEFDRATVAANYRRVALWSAGSARTQYLSLMPASNALSPFQRVPAGMVVTARVKSVSPLANGVALVRFDTARQDRSGNVSPAQPWISVVRYRFVDGAMPFEDRLVNPLGFQVTSYRRDPEAVPVPAAPAGSAAATQPPATLSSAPARFIRPAQATAPMTAIRIVPSRQVPLGSPLGYAQAATPSVQP